MIRYRVKKVVIRILKELRTSTTKKANIRKDIETTKKNKSYNKD